MKRLTEVITIEEVREWSKGEVVTISASTGTGKSYFIKNSVYLVAKERGQKILFLVHRKRCKQQFIQELEKANKLDNIDVITYQTIEKAKNFNFNKYSYIVCDEFHYFTSDSNFNYKTDISLNKILGQTNKIRILMSATGDLMKKYINNVRKINTKDYKIEPNYNWINTLNFYNKDETVEKIIIEVIDKEEKALVFIESSEKAYELHKKYKNNSLFCCSQNNKKYKKVNEEKITTMLEEERFEENLLITTTCLDAGINIIDDSIKTIICDLDDIEVLIQCLGRKRRSDNEKIDIYIHNINNNVLGGRLTRLKLGSAMARDLKKMDIKDWTDKYSKENNEFVNTLIYPDGNNIKVNELMKFKILEKGLITEMMVGNSEMKLKGVGYKEYLANNIFGIDDYMDIEKDAENNSLEEYLESIIDIRLDKDKRTELINKVNVRVNGKQQKSYAKINQGLQMLNLPYILISKRVKIDGKLETVWVLNKM